jgi:hypothetical protein
MARSRRSFALATSYHVTMRVGDPAARCASGRGAVYPRQSASCRNELTRESEALHERNFVMHCHIWQTPFSFNRSITAPA